MESGLPKGPPLDLPGALGKSGLKRQKRKETKNNEEDDNGDDNEDDVHEETHEREEVDLTVPDLLEENIWKTMKYRLPKGPPLDLPGALSKSGPTTKQKNKNTHKIAHFAFLFFGGGLICPGPLGGPREDPLGGWISWFPICFPTAFHKKS